MSEALEHYGRIVSARRPRPPVAPEPCIHRGPTLRTVRRSCCGTVEVFHCAASGREVEATRCRRCKLRKV